MVLWGATFNAVECGGHWRGFLTFIQIAHGHTVHQMDILKLTDLYEFGIFTNFKKIGKV